MMDIAMSMSMVIWVAVLIIRSVEPEYDVNIDISLLSNYSQ